jgi:hypothetical protein
VVDGKKELYFETGDKNEAKNQHQGNTKYPAQVPSIVTIGILEHDINEEYSQEGGDMYGQQEKEKVSFFEVEEQPVCCVDEANERELKRPCPVPSTASTELLGLDRIFNDLGPIMRMSSHHLRELARINYKE